MRSGWASSGRCVAACFGNLYLPGHLVAPDAYGNPERAPASAWQVGVKVDAVYTGPLTRLQKRVQNFFRGLYSAR